jgi:hypothetical protein
MSYAMKPLVAVRAGSATLCCVLVTMMGGAALAQTGGAAAPAPDPADATVKQGPPPGGCMPIGVTVSGQIVFAFQCKDFIEQQKAANLKSGGAADKPAASDDGIAAAPQQPATPEEKPAVVEEKAAARQPDARQPDGVVPAKLKGQQAALLPKHAEHGIGPRGCSHFRSYNTASGTYLSFDGQRYPCREVASQVSSRK